MVHKHYFKPGRDAFKATIEGDLLLGSGEGKTIDVKVEESREYEEARIPSESLERPWRS